MQLVPSVIAVVVGGERDSKIDPSRWVGNRSIFPLGDLGISLLVPRLSAETKKDPQLAKS